MSDEKELLTAAEMAGLRSEFEALLADARRYRHIRSREHNGYSLNNPATIGKFEVGQHVRLGEGRFYWMEGLDAAIDEAMQEKGA